jgi:hypothetical protein
MSGRECVIPLSEQQLRRMKRKDELEFASEDVSH